jgi:hypothetical protein
LPQGYNLHFLVLLVVCERFFSECVSSVGFTDKVLKRTSSIALAVPGLLVHGLLRGCYFSSHAVLEQPEQPQPQEMFFLGSSAAFQCLKNFLPTKNAQQPIMDQRMMFSHIDLSPT